MSADLDTAAAEAALPYVALALTEFGYRDRSALGPMIERAVRAAAPHHRRVVLTALADSLEDRQTNPGGVFVGGGLIDGDLLVAWVRDLAADAPGPTP